MVNVKFKANRFIVNLGAYKWDGSLTPRRFKSALGWIALVLILPAVCYWVSPGLIQTLIEANIYAAVAIPLALMALGTGRMNFGPNFYIGAGGYTAALLSVAYGWNPLVTLPFAILLSVVAALIMSPLLVAFSRLHYVAFTLLLPLIFLEITLVCPGIFHGETGLTGISPLLETGSVKADMLVVGYLSAGLMLVYLGIVHQTLKSRLGLFMATINEDEQAARSIGIAVNKIRVITFVSTAAMIGIVGWFLAHASGTFAGSAYLPLTFMLKILLVLLIGGRDRIYGCVAGAYLIAFLEMILIRIMGPIHPILFPVILLVLLFVLPNGLLGLLRKPAYRDYTPVQGERRRS